MMPVSLRVDAAGTFASTVEVGADRHDHLTADPSAVSRPRRRFWIVAIGLIVAIVAGFGIYQESRRQEQDRHEILRHLAQMEKAIRAHDDSIWTHVEGTPAHAHPDPAREAAHAEMLKDFARLADLQGFAMKDVEVEVNGDVARARYRIEGAPRPRETHPGFQDAPQQPVPAAGEVGFVRGPNGWEMTSHQLIEQRSSSRHSSPRD